MSGNEEIHKNRFSVMNNLIKVNVENRKKIEKSQIFEQKKVGNSPHSLKSCPEKIENVINSVASTSEKINIDLKNDEKEKRIIRWQKMKLNRPNAGNSTYYPPKKFHGITTMVEHKKKWTYQMACDINAAEQDGNGQMYYVADPFLPMPRSRGGASTAVRMNYAAQRLDNRKFKRQVSTVKEIAEQESASCDKCGMRYFLPSIHMQQRISYLIPAVEEDLPTVLFSCPVCKVVSKADVFS